MALLSDLFGSKVSVPSAVTVDATAEANKASQYNQSQISDYESYQSGLTQYMKNLYDRTNPNATQASNTYYNNANQLATTGTTSAVQNYQQYARRLGLEQASATGAPVSSQYGQSLGGSFSINQILQNQMQGSSMLNTYSNQQNQLTQQFTQPGMQVLNASLSTPGQFMSVATSNAQMQNNMNLQKAQADAAASPMGNFLVKGASAAAGAVAGYFSGGMASGAASSLTKGMFQTAFSSNVGDQ